MKKLILIIDDEPVNRELYREFLVHGGFDVLEAKDGAEGLEMALTTTPDFIILDYLLPKMNGCKVLQELHEHGNTRVIPLIMVTAHYDVRKILEDCPQLTAEMVFRKPISHKQILAYIEGKLYE